MPHIHGFNKHTEIIFEEVPNKDKPNYQFGGHSSVDFEEDTLPQVSGHNKDEQTIEEIQRLQSCRQRHRHQKYQVNRKMPTPPTQKYHLSQVNQYHPQKKNLKKPSKPVEQGKVVTPVIEINEKVKASGTN